MTRESAVRFEASNGSQIEDLTSRIEALHPHIFDHCDDGPVERDDKGNLVMLDQSPTCRGVFRWCVAGPDMGHIVYSTRLLHACRGGAPMSGPSA